MKDRFKFRIWDKKLKKLAKWGDNPYHNMEIMNYICVENPVTDWRHEDYILMQCTGLKEKNDKLIYEGDILKQPDGIVDYVYWENGCYLHNGTAITNYDFCYQGDSWAKEVNTHEVIGNIYENPEIIERI